MILYNVQVDIVPTMLAELLYPLQDGDTPLHFAAWGGHTTCTCVERLNSPHHNWARHGNYLHGLERIPEDFWNK